MSETVPPGTSRREHYFPALDGIRAVAILLVFTTHYSAFEHTLFPYGRLGVSVFFVLSGFLITRALLASRNDSGRFSTFYKRRSLRIFPLYFAVWAILFLLTPLLHISWNRADWLYIPYLGNLIWSIWGNRFSTPVEYVHLPILMDGARHYLYVAHFWTLCVEEQFYLFWPLVIYCTRNLKKLFNYIVWGFVVVTLSKVAVCLLSGQFPNKMIRLTIFHCDEFAWGAVLALAIFLGHELKLIRYARRIFPYAMVAVVASCWIDSTFTTELNLLRWDFIFNTFTVDLLSATTILLCLESVPGRVTRFLSWSPLRALGRVSYGFYIFHDIGHDVFRTLAGEHLGMLPDAARNLTIALVGLGTALGLALLSYRYIETPFLRLKNRFARSSAAI